MVPRPRDAGHRRDRRVGFVLLALAVYAAAAVWATWPATRHLDGATYLARPAAGAGEAAAGDHLQLGWALWLTGHQLERARPPWRDPYTFQPEASAPANLQGWLLGLPYWPLDRLFGPVWAYNLVLLASFLAAGGLAAAWLRVLGLVRAAALLGGLAFALAPYRVGQSTGHLLGPIAFLLPGMLLALERRRFLPAALCLAAIPLSGQIHLALGAVPLAIGYAWARLAREDWWKAGSVATVGAVAAVVVQQIVVEGSIAAGGRSFAQVERYSAELSDLFSRRVGAGVEELVFVGWLVPLLALAGFVVSVRKRRGLSLCLLGAAIVPCLLALGSNLPLYEQLWQALPPLRFSRVPERLMPIACLALGALLALALDTAARNQGVRRFVMTTGAAGVGLLLAADLRVPVFGAVEADRPNRAYAAFREPGRLLELPVIRPDLHHGSVYLAYVRQSPRERPLGYSTLAPPAADALARSIRPLSCGRGALPARLGIRYVAVHRGVYTQTGFFEKGCPAAAQRWLREHGWRRLAEDGAITTWERP